MKLIFNTLIVTCNYLILEVNLNKDEIFYGCSVVYMRILILCFINRLQKRRGLSIRLHFFMFVTS